MSQTKPAVCYRVIEATNPNVELTRVVITRLDFEPLSSSDVSDLVTEMSQVFPSEKYRLRERLGFVDDEVLSVWVNPTRDERVKRGGNPIDNMIVPRKEVEGNMRKISKASRAWIPK